MLSSKELIATVNALRKHKLTATHQLKEEALYGPTTSTIVSMLVSKKTGPTIPRS